MGTLLTGNWSGILSRATSVFSGFSPAVVWIGGACLGFAFVAFALTMLLGGSDSPAAGGVGVSRVGGARGRGSRGAKGGSPTRALSSMGFVGHINSVVFHPVKRMWHGAKVEYQRAVRDTRQEGLQGVMNEWASERKGSARSDAKRGVQE